MEISLFARCCSLILGLTIGVGLFCSLVPEALAQATCNSVVSYVVEREKTVQNEIFFGELRAQGPDEIGTKAKLEAETLRAKARALETCKSQYENLSGCLQTKLAASGSTLQAASFSARKALEDALLSDCQKQVGICKESKASEIKCVIAEPTVATDAKAGDAKKGEKPKK